MFHRTVNNSRIQFEPTLMDDGTVVMIVADSPYNGIAQILKISF